jgi:hypothetical protein
VVEKKLLHILEKEEQARSPTTTRQVPGWPTPLQDTLSPL